MVLIVATVRVSAEEPISAKKLLSIEGTSFIEAAKNASYMLYPGSDSPYTAEELIAIATKLADDVKSVPDSPKHYLSPFGNFFEAACESANGSQVDQLIQIYLRLNPASFEKMEYLPPLAAAWIHRELKDIHGKKASLAPFDLPPPRALADAPKDLLEAWRFYKGCMAPYEKTFPDGSSKEQMSYELNLHGFFKLVDAVLVGQGPDSDNALPQFTRTGANCLDMHDFEANRSIAMLMTLLHQRRINEVVGAALLASPSERQLVTNAGKTDAIIETLQTVGIDWEPAITGALVERETREWGSGREQWLQMLASQGSDRAAPLVNQLAHWVKLESRDPYVEALNTFIDGSESAKGCDSDGGMREWSSGSMHRVSKVKIDKKVQVALLATVEAFATSDASENLASAAVMTFGRTHSPSSVPALRRLTLHRSRQVAENAARVLCAMGETTGSLVSSKPVRFQVMINGHPLPDNLEVNWRVDSQSSSRSSRTETKGDGIVELERDDFPQPGAASASVVLSAFPPKTLNDPIFDVEMPIPTDLDSLTRAEVSTGQMLLNLRNLNHLNGHPPPKTAKLAMSLHRQDSDIWLDGTETFDVPLQPTIAITNVQNGTYDVSLTIAGAQKWAGKATVGSDVAPTDVWLKPGSDLHYEVFTPSRDFWYPAMVLKDGKEFSADRDFETHVSHGLPRGNYVLHIPSTDELKRHDNQQGIKAGPDEMSFSGRDIPFTIGPDSPATIDLGEIHLEPVARQ